MTYHLVETSTRVEAVDAAGTTLAGAFLKGTQPQWPGHTDWALYAGPFVGAIRYPAHCFTKAAAVFWVRLAASNPAEEWAA